MMSTRRITGFAELSTLSAMVTAVSMPAAALAAAGPGAPMSLLCEYEPAPLAVDTPAPRLSWRVNDNRRGAMQSAYQVLVAAGLDALNANQGDMWDSGKVNRSHSAHVAYAGKPLDDGKACYWKVRTWDAAGVASPYSKPASWEMGFLKPSDWQARWIALGKLVSPEEAEVSGWRDSKWIWHLTRKGENEDVWLRRAFELDKNVKVKKARVRCTADDSFELFINGQNVGSGGNWQEMFDFQVGDKLRPGRNVIAVKAHNATGPAGLTFSMRVDLEGNPSMWVQSSDGWRAADTEQPGWEKADFDDSKWPKARVIGDFGCEPWGKKPTAPKTTFLRSMMARKEFNLDNKIAKARVRVCGLGAYELRINGRRVGNDILTPGWTQFHKRVQYQTYDVTGMLRTGANAVAAILGNGWWHGRIGGENGQPGRESLRLILQLDVHCADGSHMRLVSDPTWKTHVSPIFQDDIYDGETYDARTETPGWDTPGFNDAEWTAAGPVDQPIETLVPQAKETIQAIQDLPAVKVTEPKPGQFVFDFGQNLTGWCRLTVKGKAGNEVTLRHAEVLNRDGTIYTANLRSAKATDRYTLKGEGTEVWEPRFTYHGFRYTEVTGYPGKPGEKALVARMICSAAPQIGEFQCSVDLLNRIQHNILWGQRGNMYSVPTDCPQRDERLGWMGDTQMFANTACWNLDMSRFFTKWMRDIRDCQGSDGATRDVNPSNGWGPASPAWGDAAVIVPWQVYRHYGDTRIIEENYKCMAGWIGYMTANSKGSLFERDGYGDWIAVVPSPKPQISAAYYYYDCVLMARMATAVGRYDDAQIYADMACDIRNAFNVKFLDRQANQYPGHTQTANLLPLFFGLVPEHRIDAVAQNVAKNIIGRYFHLSTGFLGTGYINPVLTQTGHHDLAWKLAAQSTYPSWGYMVKKDATTIWELWNSDTAGPGMNSRNHFCLGSVGEWFYETLAGITPDDPGFRVIRIQPRPVGELSWVKASLNSLYGPIACAWQLKSNSFCLQVKVPANTEARIFVPTFGKERFKITEGGRTMVEDGQYAGSVRGITFIGMEGDFAGFRSGAGEYSLVAQGVGTPPMPKYDAPPMPPSISELTDDFSGSSIDDKRWQVVDMGLESQAPSSIAAGVEGGNLVIAGGTDVNYWTGRTLLSRGAFSIGNGQRLEVQVNRASFEPKGSGARSSLWFWVDSQNYLMFSQDSETGTWSFNLNGGAGNGVELAKATDNGPHVMKMIHDGESIHLFLDGKELKEVPVTWREGIHVALTGQVRQKGDSLTVKFDTLQAELRKGK
jgi:alpha-L-rhamnosidase